MEWEVFDWYGIFGTENADFVRFTVDIENLGNNLIMKIGSSEDKNVWIVENGFVSDPAVGLTPSFEGMSWEFVKEISHLVIKIIALIWIGS